LYEQHGCLVGDLRSGGTDDSKLKPEPSCANRDRLACNLLALLGAPKDINKINPLASRK
jgi:hypothetical protein